MEKEAGESGEKDTKRRHRASKSAILENVVVTTHGQWRGGGWGVRERFTHGLRSQNRPPPNALTDPPMDIFLNFLGLPSP